MKCRFLPSFLAESPSTSVPDDVRISVLCGKYRPCIVPYREFLPQSWRLKRLLTRDRAAFRGRRGVRPVAGDGLPVPR